jgi:hypothetical protein
VAAVRRSWIARPKIRQLIGGRRWEEISGLSTRAFHVEIARLSDQRAVHAAIGSVQPSQQGFPDARDQRGPLGLGIKIARRCDLANVRTSRALLKEAMPSLSLSGTAFTPRRGRGAA